MNKLFNHRAWQKLGWERCEGAGVGPEILNHIKLLPILVHPCLTFLPGRIPSNPGHVQGLQLPDLGVDIAQGCISLNSGPD